MEKTTIQSSVAEEKLTDKFNKNILIEYIRDGFIGKKVYTKDGVEYTQSSRSPKGRGVLVALGENKIGWALLSPKEPKVDWNVGRSLAYSRASSEEWFKTQYNTIPKDIKEQVDHFILRAKNTFQAK